MNTEQSYPNLALLLEQGFSDSILERFWSKVKKTDGCWYWTGATSGKGRYGKIHKAGHACTEAYAHRVSWILHNGAIPDGLDVLHNCPNGDNPLCVNPAHLWLGTAKQNLQDASRKGRTHRGYKLTEEQIREIVNLRSAVSGKELACRYGVSQSTISQIVHGTRHIYRKDPLIISDQRSKPKRNSVR